MPNGQITLSFDKDLVGSWVFNQVGKCWGPEGREAIGLVRDGEVLAGVVFEDYTGVAIQAHIAISSPRVPFRKLLSAAAGYAFNQLRVEKILGMVPSSNKAALKMDLRIGFRPEAVIKGVFKDADLVIMSMAREDCSFIPKPLPHLRLVGGSRG
jgi:RimJ/RimL family protein N-acetyltransferase